MMNEKQFVESQKECAAMLGMSLSEYQEYCKNLKVPNNGECVDEKRSDGNTYKFLKQLGIDSSVLKTRKDY